MNTSIKVGIAVLIAIILGLVIYIIIDKTVLTKSCQPCICPNASSMPDFGNSLLGNDILNIYKQFATVDQTVAGIEQSSTLDHNTKCNNLNNIINIINNRKRIVDNIVNKIVQDRLNIINTTKQKLQCS